MQVTKVLVLYYSSYGHTEAMASAVSEGVEAAGAQPAIRQVAELVPAEIAAKSHYKMDQPAPIATVDELAQYDAIIVGSGTRYGRMTSQMANFWDQTGGLWSSGGLIGKVGAAFTSTASQHGGQETTLLGIHTMLLHQGMVIVGLPYSFKGQLTLDEVSGGTPYGASTLAGGDGSRQPSENELVGARFLGRHVAGIAAKLFR